MLAIGACLLDHSKLDLYKQCATSIYNLCTHMHTRASLNTIHTHAYISRYFSLLLHNYIQFMHTHAYASLTNSMHTHAYIMHIKIIYLSFCVNMSV